MLGVGLLLLSSLSSLAEAGAILSSVTRQTLNPVATDFFALGQRTAGEVAFGLATPISGLPADFDTPDTVLATFFTADVGPGDISADIITINDDSDADNNSPGGDSFGSLFRIEIPVDDDYSVGVTGAPNFFDDFPHNQQGDYLMTFGVVDPSTAGGDFLDSDGSNESLAGADVLNLSNSPAQVAVNSLTPQGLVGDVDIYEITLTAGDVFTAMTAPLSVKFGGPDTTLIFMDDQGTILFDDEEAGGPVSDGSNDLGIHDGNGSAVHFNATTSGTYYLAVTGDGDDFADGTHTEFGSYGLLVSRISAVPEPGPLSMFSLMVLVMGCLRRANTQIPRN